MNKDAYAPILLSFLLILGIVTVFWPVPGYEFLNYDDDIYVTDNVHVCGGMSWENVKWAFGTIEAGFWQPLTWLSLMLDYEIFHLNAGGYHWTNVLFHIANTLLLFFVLRRMTGALWKSGLVAALFAVHPSHVESVAWIAARKDVLSTFFWMLTLWAYVVYVERPKVARYLGVLLFYGLGLMAKPMVVTLPFVLLLLDCWPLDRFNKVSMHRLLLEKVPLALVSLPVIWLTFAAEQKVGALSSLDTLSWPARASNALVSYVLYLGKTIYPLHLSVYYPHPGQWPLGANLLSAGFLAALTSSVIYWRKRYAFLGTGWLWYLATLLPVIGLVQVGSHGMADRYTYVPLIGIFVILVWGCDALGKGIRYGMPVQTGLAVLSLMVLMGLSLNQVSYWRNGVVLARHTLAVIGKHSGTLNNLGNALARRGQLEDAILQYREALELTPDYPDARNNLGNALVKQGKLSSGIAQYAEALRLDPRNIKAHFNIAIAFTILGNDQEAIRHYRELLNIRPDFAAAWNNLAIVYANRGDMDQAIIHFRQVLRINPNYQAARENLALALRQKGSASR